MFTRALAILIISIIIITDMWPLIQAVGGDSRESLELSQNWQNNLTSQLESISNKVHTVYDSLEHLPVHTCGQGRSHWSRRIFLGGVVEQLYRMRF